MLQELGLDDADTAWIQRFGQVGRLAIDRRGVRAVTWLLSFPEGLIEVHFWASTKGVVTLWQGEPGLLDEVREQFVERFSGASRSHYHGAAILLQLLLAPLDQAFGMMDERLHDLHDRIQKQSSSIDLALVSSRLQLLRDIWLKLDRYAGAVRSATVGIEAIANIDSHGVRELNEYVEHVEDTEGRLHERFQWGSAIIQSYATALAQRQGEQINRLTIVSIIFLPISFLTGFFGMNFNWMAENLGSLWAFLTLGVLLPVVCAVVTGVWLKKNALL